ncbi:MAG TPA: OB-fold domain-containing protein [Streptosporangiaceae bacterium]|nr:OB-fold domain-containing protein [Streptosporangiaceae bacterium]
MSDAIVGPAEIAEIAAVAQRIKAAGDCDARPGRDPVNLTAIRDWTEVIYGRPATEASVAPPAMIQVWTMPGLHGDRGGDDPLGTMMRVLDEAGYPSVVATNCAQVYHRYLKVGEQLTVRSRLLDVTGPKHTALGEGWFVTVRSAWYAGAAEEVATMDFRVLKFRTGSGTGTGTGGRSDAATAAQEPPRVMRPQITRDTAFFWQGAASGELRIQRCVSCGAVRHPPGPMCPACHAPASGEYVVARGTGTVYSYVVHHHPPVPGKRLPLVIALVELPEGVRVTGELHGVAPDDVTVGMPVRVDFLRMDDDLTLPMWRPAAQEPLPPMAIAVTPTFVVASALATRDFYPVHHDRQFAIASGAKDLFVNILTTTGLVQRYAAEWGGPDALIKGIDLRLGVPCYAGDTLTFGGCAAPSADGEWTLTIGGRCPLGEHVTATVRVERA